LSRRRGSKSDRQDEGNDDNGQSNINNIGQGSSDKIGKVDANEQVDASDQIPLDNLFSGKFLDGNMLGQQGIDGGLEELSRKIKELTDHA
ncbi:MAG: hypothetical protein EZS28_046676, partial [Streblomastix strix]